MIILGYFFLISPCTVERSSPKVGVSQILKRCLEYFSSYEHFSKLKRGAQTWV